MKRFSTTPITFVLIVTLLIFSIFCCCLTHFTQAEEILPPCHQSSRQADQSHHDQDCACDKNVALYETESSHQINLVQSALVIFDFNTSILSAPVSSLNLVSSKSPPDITTVPLYIRNSVLRI